MIERLQNYEEVEQRWKKIKKKYLSSNRYSGQKQDLTDLF